MKKPFASGRMMMQMRMCSRYMCMASRASGSDMFSIRDTQSGAA